MDTTIEAHGLVKRFGDTTAVAGDVAARVAAAARVLAAVGEWLQPGDRLITGSVVQVPVRPGDRVTADLGSLGRVELTVTA